MVVPDEEADTIVANVLKMFGAEKEKEKAGIRNSTRKLLA